MLTKAQASTMFALQASMNAKIDPNWVESRYPYLLAVVIEGAEAIEHHGWKWWKKQDKDVAQLQMELIDIWHFMLSELLLRNNADETAAVTQLLNELATAEGTLHFDGKTYRLSD
jgi:dimeric dUTPase (all-alpha-NTP-PPase superfamily)